jgi:hypothetical protein
MVKDGKVDISSFSRVAKVSMRGMMMTFYDEQHKIILEIEMTFEQFGRAISGHGYVDMKYKKRGT